MSLTQQIFCDGPECNRPLTERGARSRTVLRVDGVAYAIKLMVDMEGHNRETDLCERCLSRVLDALGRQLQPAPPRERIGARG